MTSLYNTIIPNATATSNLSHLMDEQREGELVSSSSALLSKKKACFCHMSSQRLQLLQIVQINITKRAKKKAC